MICSPTTPATWPVHSDSPVQSPDGLDPEIIGTPRALNWPRIRDLDEKLVLEDYFLHREAHTRCVRRRSPNYDDWDASAGGARSARITLDGRLLYFVRRAHLIRVEAIDSLVALPIKLNPPPTLPSHSVPSSMSSTGSPILAVERYYHLQSLFWPRPCVSCADGPHGRSTHRRPFLLACAYSRRLRWLFVCRDTGFVLLLWATLSSDQEWRVWISSSVECPPST